MRENEGESGREIVFFPLYREHQLTGKYNINYYILYFLNHGNNTSKKNINLKNKRGYLNKDF